MPTNRKDNIFMQRQLWQIFTCILEWGQGTCKKSRLYPAQAYTILVELVNIFEQFWEQISTFGGNAEGNRMEFKNVQRYGICLGDSGSERMCLTFSKRQLNEYYMKYNWTMYQLNIWSTTGLCISWIYEVQQDYVSVEYMKYNWTMYQLNIRSTTGLCICWIYEGQLDYVSVEYMKHNWTMYQLNIYEVQLDYVSVLNI